MKKILSFIIVGLLILVVPLMSFVPEAQSKDKIRFTFEAGNAIKTNGYKTAKNLMAKGYEVDIIKTAGGTQAVQFVLGGQADVAINDTDEILLAVAQGGDLKMFMSNSAKIDYVLVAADPSIKSAKDLQGKVVGMSGPSGFDALMGRIYMQKAGLDPASPKWTVVGGSPDRMKALEVGRIDAAVIFIPHYLELKAKGSKCHKVVDMADVVPDVLKGVYYAKTDWINKNPDAVKDIIRAQLDANKWFHENKAEWVDLAMELAKGSTKSAVEILYDALKKVDMFPLDGGVTKEGAATMVKMMVEAGDLKKPIPVEKFMYLNAYKEVLKERK